MRALADLVGASESQISRLLSGETQRSTLVDEIAAVLALDPQYSDDAERLLARLEQLPTEVARVVIAQLERLIDEYWQRKRAADAAAAELDEFIADPTLQSRSASKES